MGYAHSYIDAQIPTCSLPAGSTYWRPRDRNKNAELAHLTKLFVLQQPRKEVLMAHQDKIQAWDQGGSYRHSGNKEDAMTALCLCTPDMLRL